MSNQTETSSGETVIEISNVWKIFGTQADAALRAIQEEGLGKAEVLETYNAVVGVADVSFEVKKGEIFCVMGLSGSGKSTLVRHFNRLLEPTSGKIVIHGTDVMGLGTQDLMDFRNRKIGMVFQNFALLPHRSVLDNVAMPLEIRNINKNERMRRAANMLKTVELDAWGNKYAHELSGGMQQRVALARCLANDPDVILMDEPLGALDALTREKMQSLVLDLWKDTGKTIILITHSVEEALLLGERLLVMAPRPGRIHKEYRLPFAEMGVGADLREVKHDPKYGETREEILNMIWDMEEEIMGRTENVA